MNDVRGQDASDFSQVYGSQAYQSLASRGVYNIRYTI